MSKIRLFYIEDEPSLGKIVKESLESRDFEVKMLTTGKDALEAYTEFQPDVCVLDVMLPHKDGFTIGKEIRELHAQVPILYVTAKNQTEDVLQGFSSGGNDYIRKPFSMEELIVRIKNLIAISTSAKQNKGEQKNIGALVYYPLRQELHAGNDIKRLSHRENELLLLLTENLNHMVSRKQILDQIWGNDSIFNSRNLDVYITKLRDHLKPDTSVELITLKGVGYRLIG